MPFSRRALFALLAAPAALGAQSNEAQRAMRRGKAEAERNQGDAARRTRRQADAIGRRDANAISREASREADRRGREAERKDRQARKQRERAERENAPPKPGVSPKQRNADVGEKP